MENLNLFKISNEEMLKRFKSWLWRLGMMIAALVIDFLVVNLTDFNIPSWSVIPIGLALGELSKQINNNLTKVKELAGVGLGRMGAKVGSTEEK